MVLVLSKKFCVSSSLYMPSLTLSLSLSLSLSRSPDPEEVIRVVKQYAELMNRLGEQTTQSLLRILLYMPFLFSVCCSLGKS